MCQTPIAVTLRDPRRYADLTGLARIRWVTRTSGFHVVRPVVKLADGTWYVGDYGEGAATAVEDAVRRNNRGDAVGERVVLFDAGGR